MDCLVGDPACLLRDLMRLLCDGALAPHVRLARRLAVFHGCDAHGCNIIPAHRKRQISQLRNLVEIVCIELDTGLDKPLRIRCRLFFCPGIRVKPRLFHNGVDPSLKIAPVDAVRLLRIIFSITALPLAVVALGLTDTLRAGILCLVDIFYRGRLAVHDEILDGIIREFPDPRCLHHRAHKLCDVFFRDWHVTFLQRIREFPDKLVDECSRVCPAPHDLFYGIQIKIVIISCYLDSCLCQRHLDPVYNRHIRLHVGASRRKSFLLHLLEIFP